MIDLQEIARAAMEKAKMLLRRDGSLMPVCIVHAPFEEMIIGLQFNSPETKQMAFRDVSEIAKEYKALAVTTIFDSFVRTGNLEDLEKYRNGDRDFRKNLKSVEAISVATKSGKKAWLLSCEYKRDGKKIIFEKVNEMDGCEFNMLPDWDLK